MPLPVSIKKSGPGFKALAEKLNKIQNSDVLVGIPASTARRTGSPINNASLLFILSNGSPLHGIPARPVLDPAVKKNWNTISPHLKAAAQDILHNQPEKAAADLAKAGMAASNAAKRYVMQGNNLAPNAPSTIKRKKSDRPLIDTNAMIRAITYVVRERTGTAERLREGKMKQLEEANAKVVAGETAEAAAVVEAPLAEAAETIGGALL